MTRALKPSAADGLAQPVGQVPVHRPGSLPPLTKSKLSPKRALHATTPFIIHAAACLQTKRKSSQPAVVIYRSHAAESGHVALLLAKTSRREQQERQTQIGMARRRKGVLATYTYSRVTSSASSTSVMGTMPIMPQPLESRVPTHPFSSLMSR
jgi:hypothetical protein